MRHRRLTSITSQYQWVLHMLQASLRSMQRQNFYGKRDSMEFNGTARVIEIGAHQIPWNSIASKLAHSKFHHGTARVIEIGVLPSSMKIHGIFLLNLMEPVVSSILWIFNLDRTPSNFEFPDFDDRYIQFCWMNQFPKVNKHPISFCITLSPTFILS